jgi:metal-responsive CopG/Arc/MetJ family transcriptional regulator
MSDKKDVERIERVITPIPSRLLKAIDEYRWSNRVPSRSEAIRKLIRRGLGDQYQQT